MKSIKNSYGISEKMMCASCEFKMNTESVKKRRCTKKKKDGKAQRLLQVLGNGEGLAECREASVASLRNGNVNGN